MTGEVAVRPDSSRQIGVDKSPGAFRPAGMLSNSCHSPETSIKAFGSGLRQMCQHPAKADLVSAPLGVANRSGSAKDLKPVSSDMVNSGVCAVTGLANG